MLKRWRRWRVQRNLDKALDLMCKILGNEPVDSEFVTAVRLAKIKARSWR